MGRAVAIIGVGQTQHGRRMDVAYPDLVREAVLRVFEDTGLSPEDIDGVVSGTMPSMMEGIALTHFYFADAMQAIGKPILKTETCGSTGVSIAHTAYYWVASGMADLVLAVGHEKMNEGNSQATMTTVAEPFYQRYFISGAPGRLFHAVPDVDGPLRDFRGKDPRRGGLHFGDAPRQRLRQPLRPRQAQGNDG